MYISADIYTHTSVCIYLCICVYMYTHTHISVDIYTHILFSHYSKYWFMERLCLSLISYQLDIDKAQSNITH